MRAKGHYRSIVEITPVRKNPPTMLQDASDKLPTPELTGRTDFIYEIRDLLKRTRGRELPGMFNPLIVGDLFCEQSRPWEALARQHLQDTWDVARVSLELIASHLADDTIVEALLREIIEPLMDEKLGRLNQKLDELLEPYRRGHPITYNH